MISDHFRVMNQRKVDDLHLAYKEAEEIEKSSRHLPGPKFPLLFGGIRCPFCKRSLQSRIAPLPKYASSPVRCCADYLVYECACGYAFARRLPMA